MDVARLSEMDPIESSVVPLAVETIRSRKEHFIMQGCIAGEL